MMRNEEWERAAAAGHGYALRELLLKGQGLDAEADNQGHTLREYVESLRVEIKRVLKKSKKR
jgi:hypothetical protein